MHGVSLEATAPFSQYDSEKLLNVGTNRWSFKPSIGISKTIEPVTFELAAGVRFFTDNTDFLGEKLLEVSPVYSVQSHLIYSFLPGFWVGLDGLYYAGAQPTIDGRTGESNENARVGLTLTVPVNIRNSMKLYGSTGVYSKTGTDYKQVGVAWQFRWGAGL